MLKKSFSEIKIDKLRAIFKNIAEWLIKYRGPLFLGLIVILFFLPTLTLRRAYLSGDLGAYFYPLRVFMSSSLKSGHLPVMCPYLFCGFPLYAESQAGLFYVVNFIGYLLPNIFAHSYSIILHYLMIVLFTYLYTRTIKLSRTASVFAALSFGFGGFAIAHLVHPNIIASLAFFPLILYLLEKALQKDSLPFSLGAGVVLGVQFLTGFMMLSLFTVMIAFFYILFYPRENRWAGAGLLRAAGMFAVFILVGAGIGMIQNLPTYELVKISMRTNYASDFFNMNHFTVSALPGFVLPSSVRFSGFLEVYGYIGLLPVFLAPAAFLKKASWHVKFFTAAGLIALLISFGYAGGLYKIIHMIPGFSVLRAPGRFVMIVDFALVVLGAIGLDKLLDRNTLGKKSMNRYVWFVTGFSTLLVGGIVLLTGLTRRNIINIEFFRTIHLRSRGFYILVILIAVILALLWLWRLGFFSRNLYAVALIAIIIIDLFLANWAFHPLLDTRKVTEVPASMAAIQQDKGVFRVMNVKYPGKASLKSYSNNLMMYGIEEISGYATIRYRRYNDQLMTSGNTSSPTPYNIMNVRYFISGLKNVDGRIFDLNRPLIFNKKSREMSLQVGGTPSQKIEILSNIYDTPPGNFEGDIKPVAYLEVRTDNGMLKPIAIYPDPVTTVSIDDGTGVKQQATPVYIKDENRYTYKNTIDLGGNHNIREVTVIPYWLSPSQRVSIDAMDLVGTQSTPVELGPIIYMDDWQVIYKNPGELPRAYVVSGAWLNQKLGDLFTLDPASIADHVELKDTELTPEQLAQVESWDPDRKVSGTAKLVSPDREKQVFEVETSADTVLVWSENYMPGWSATVDGKPENIVSAYYGLSAVFVKEGKHEVIFTYNSPGLKMGAVITLATLIIIFVWLLYFFIRRRRNHGVKDSPGNGDCGL